MKLQKAFAVIGAVVVLFAGFDALTYAATGSSLIIGRLNQANATTTLQNTGTGPALKLTTKSTASPPLAVNGKGKVTNLYADRAATADNATKFGGKTPAQVAAATRPANVIWVAKSGGQFKSVKAALASITDNDAAHPYLIVVGPGTFVETSTITLKDYVDIEGSGRDRTTVRCACHGVGDAANSTISVSSPFHTELRDLTVTNVHTIANGAALAVYVGAPTPTISLTHLTLTALASGANSVADGLYVASGLFGPHLDDLNVYVVGSPGGNVAIGLNAPTIVRNSWLYTSGFTVLSSVPSSMIGSTVVGTASGLTGHCSGNFTPSGAPYNCP